MAQHLKSFKNTLKRIKKTTENQVLADDSSEAESTGGKVNGDPT